MKHLPKHLQPRWRYLAVELRGGGGLTRDAFQRACWFTAQDLLGDVGSAALDLTVVAFAVDDGKGHAVVRTHRGESDSARAVLACVDAVDGTDLGVRVSGVGGTVRACLDAHL